MALMKNATDAMKESRISDLIASLNALQYRRTDFEEFCAAALSVHQLEALDHCKQHARCVYELFERDGNRAIVIEELASELGFGPSIPLHVVLHDWIRHTDGNLDLLHGVSRATNEIDPMKKLEVINMASSAAAIPPQEKYDVFLSFRGEDTLYTFTSHLYAALCSKKIKTCIDDILERGEQIAPALFEAIEASKLSAIIFSKNYASSTWCLDELSSCFLAVREELEKHGLKHLRNVLREILNEKDLTIDTPSIGSTSARERLSHTKVLIVLDDVNDSKQLELLVVDYVRFGPGSRIIITIRDRCLLKKLVDADKIYKRFSEWWSIMP
ncbi:PREDICTED: CDPK-related [Prunus dulcis]|uniref:PREDICTED: CDPK-related n=1 Tax=Prunus dulcis TaxID=3755 RepID=A0A5E4GHH2_PRUDU|nr:PREDICTED: CDPK-related [Prunus dulcis]